MSDLITLNIISLCDTYVAYVGSVGLALALIAIDTISAALAARQAELVAAAVAVSNSAHAPLLGTATWGHAHPVQPPGCRRHGHLALHLRRAVHVLDLTSVTQKKITPAR